MTALAGGAAAFAALAVLLARPPGAWIVAIRTGRIGGPSWSRLRRLGRPVGGVLVVTAVVVVASVAGPPRVVVAATALGAALFVWRQVVAVRTRTAAGRRRTDTCVALDLLAAELRAGILPQHALAALGDDVPALRPAATAAAHGGDVPAALRTAGREPGASALHDLAAAWQVAERVGAPLAGVLDRVAATVRDDAEVEREVRSEAAPARATGRLMAVLPVLGLSLGAGLGADPVHVLTGTLPGSLCLATGVALACAGVAWVDRIAAAPEVGR
ncbi:type II secretion system F family protein [Aeromicrobium terrae]|uniref:type II secretion system F family protein n=1 Tax=Aeromicrobium terrae TaxID=2498846 RepID=UPI00164FA13A|nr:type II secretion system F family protein [Aeromicrobium terrae]